MVGAGYSSTADRVESNTGPVCSKCGLPYKQCQGHPSTPETTAAVPRSVNVRQTEALEMIALHLGTIAEWLLTEPRGKKS